MFAVQPKHRVKKNVFKMKVLDGKNQPLSRADSFALAEYSTKVALESADVFANFALVMHLSKWQWVGREGKAVAI